MKSRLTFFGIVLSTGLAVLAISLYAPLPVPYFQDFSVMYFTDKALINGIHIYDYPSQLTFVKALTPANFSFHPFPYPPWYALSTLLIGLLPIQAAARAWFFLNLGMLSLSVWLLTPGWKLTTRSLGVLAGIMFIPAFGLLVVGQYSAPVLLGAALFIYSARHKTPFWSAVGLLLLTFKPHIGGLMCLAGVVWLIFERSAFSRRALWLTIAGGLFLAGIGFLADPAWPLTYIQSLGRYRDIPGVLTCGLCASLSVALVRVFSGQSNTLAASAVSLGLALLAGLLLFGRFRACLKNPAVLMAVFATLTLLIDPYLLNYDYVLLILPLLWLVRRNRLVLVLYFVPWAAVALGQNGNILLALDGLVTFILILRQAIIAIPRGIDSRAGEAYNHINN
jgi:hypothetical protein